MKTDYSYCLNEDTCLHRRACLRWIGNYTNEEAKELVCTGRDEYIDDKDCIPNLKDVDCDNDYDLLDRFRLSHREEFQ